MRLLIDDIRSIENVDVTVRSYDAGIDNLKTRKFDHVIIDHDLGYDKTGYDILKWCEINKIWPETVELITSNPVGRENMERVLISNNYFKINNRLFIKRYHI